jgi:UDPglucose 6-dehydrogenase
MVAGVRSPQARAVLQPILSYYTKNILWMRPESAEMTKHALNAFLALEIAFANEVARLCERSGASMAEVSQGLKSDIRIGQEAYLAAGSAYSGGTLARDVASLNHLAERVGESTKLLSAIATSNEEHKQWYWLRLKDQLTYIQGRKIVIFGLTYKAQTNTLRRSAAMELAERLSEAGADVVGWDPVVKTMPDPWSKYMRLADTPEEAADEADALVISTYWPEFRAFPWVKLLSSMKRPLILDPGHTLADALPSVAEMVYLCVGE